jgi:S1-C subfamily serine protease
LDYVEPKTTSELKKPTPIRPDKGKKGRFKDKEEYLAWAEKRKKKLLRRAAVKAALKENLRSFFRGKVYLEKKFILGSSLVVLTASILFFFSMKPPKAIPWSPERMPALEQMETPLSYPLSEAGRKATPGEGDKPYPLEDLLPQARKIMVLVKTPQGCGTGFLLPHPGFVATCAHFLGESNEAEVHLANGVVKKGAVSKKLSLPLDVAFIQIEDFGLDRMPFADSDHCQEGEEAVAVGIPGRERWRPDLVLVKGKIVHCHKPFQGIQYLQMSLDLPPATMGGPIFNARGDIIGISKGELAGSGFEGARYGLAINVVKGFMDQRLYHLEEKTRGEEQFFKYIYDYLWSGLYGAHQAYQKRLYDLYAKGDLSAQEAARLDKKGLQPPVGYSSMKNWVAELTERVIRGELSKEKAAAQIQSHFEQ